MVAPALAASRSGRDLFWAQPPPLPPGLRLTQLEAVVVPRRGRGGETVFDLARLQTPAASALLVIAFRSPATGKDALAARDQLRTVVDDLRRRSAATPTAGIPYLPVLATEVATPTVIDACVREGLGVIDRRGTIILHGGPVYVHVEGHASVERTSRIRVFSGKACRIVRVLLAQPGQRFKPAELAATARTSYAFVHGVLAKLERDGFLVRSSPRSGFRVSDATGLLKAWLSSGERTAVSITPYFAPDTRPAALAAAEAAARASGVKTVFTLASALLPGEAFVAGLPHGLYVSGDVAPIEDALKLERATTPHNFLVLRAEPAAEASEAGIYGYTRPLAHGAGVALPQLASDFATAGGRGREQADRLVELYSKSLPPPELES
jgi:hypothetical protein